MTSSPFATQRLNTEPAVAGAYHPRLEARASPACGSHPRFLHAADIEALLLLEQCKWSESQRADRVTLLERIEQYPNLCVGAFDPQNRALASLFLKPITPRTVHEATTWADCIRAEGEFSTHVGSLFGISFSSRNPAAARALLSFFWPHLLKLGCREIYLGSPMPGLRTWRTAHPAGDVHGYARQRSRGLPIDPQLRYYHARGFKTVVGVKEGYFPHEASMDCAAVLHGRIPLAFFAPLWRRLPLPWVAGVTRALKRLLR